MAAKYILRDCFLQHKESTEVWAKIVKNIVYLESKLLYSGIWKNSLLELDHFDVFDAVTSEI